ncbi:MAG: glycosyltransferase family 4 protein [Planctomycetes bacterium]|nr:glycosyltransferase family 4 protein [Planctomycetota bacterium]
MAKSERTEKKEIIFISSYVPRQCGIATFTHDLVHAVSGIVGKSYRCGVVAINDRPEGYRYDSEVRFEIRESIQNDYRRAAEFINISNAQVVCLQHEYGLFGGPSGAHILTMLRRLRRPLVSTLHTVLTDPTSDQRQVLNEICQLSTKVVVMSLRARQILQDIYGVMPEKIAIIPHGIPDVPFVDPAFYKDKFGVEGRELILSFGLLSPGKGFEYAIRAMPAIVKKFPRAVYMIVGATHPQIRKRSGEKYRSSLQQLARELGVAENVIFQNRFVELEELCEFLCAADICVIPYLNEAQVVSGVLAYAIGTGNAVISTPFWHAQELLADDRGRLVPFRDPDAIAKNVLELLSDDLQRDAMRKRAYQYSRQMVWKEVAKQYIDVFSSAQKQPIHPILMTRSVASSISSEELPEIDLRHLRMLTDDTGIIQHCLYATPDRRFGYATDDNARALIVASMYWHQTHDETILPLLQTYLSFLNHAFDLDLGRFRNFMNYSRQWTEMIGSEDSHGRALWGLGVCIAMCSQEAIIGLATKLFKQALPAVDKFVSPRAWAFSIVGIQAYLQRFGGDSEAKRIRSSLAEKLYNRFVEHAGDDWPWCENVVTYDNAKLPQALLMSGKWMFRSDIIEMGERALRWLLEVQTSSRGNLSIIGTNGWFPRGGTPARFDQQPIETEALVEACLEAYNVTGDDYWLYHARRCFNWFLGDNDIQTPVYDFTTGGCHDGIHPDRINQNQGAESTLAWLISLLLMTERQTQQTLQGSSADRAIEADSLLTSQQVSSDDDGLEDTAQEALGKEG